MDVKERERVCAKLHIDIPQRVCACVFTCATYTLACIKFPTYQQDMCHSHTDRHILSEILSIIQMNWSISRWDGAQSL